MDSLAQREMFRGLGEYLRQELDLPESVLQWVKSRKNLQLAYYRCQPYKWERVLMDNGVAVRGAWSFFHHLGERQSSGCVDYCEKMADAKIDRLFFGSAAGSGDDPAFVQHRFVALLYRSPANGGMGVKDKEKENEAVKARNLASAISERLGRGPKQLLAYGFGSSITVYSWAGLLSVVEKDFIRYAAMSPGALELEGRFKDMLSASVRQVHTELDEASVIAFSERLYDDQGLIMVFKDGLSK